MEEHILICEDSLEGIFTAVYVASEKRYKPEQTGIQTSEEGNLRLFAVYERVENDDDKCGKVMRTLQKRFGEEGFYIFCLALASTDSQKATAVYRTIMKGLCLSAPARIFERHADADIQKVMKLKYNAWHEMHQLSGFVRFRELENGVMFSEIQPKNNVIVFLADHFADRFPMENFMICDCGRSLFAIHEAGRQWLLTKAPYFEKESIRMSQAEETYQELFRHFCHKIAVEGRRNEPLQEGMLPLRFRPYMTEFMEKSDQ